MSVTKSMYQEKPAGNNTPKETDNQDFFLLFWSIIPAIFVLITVKYNT